MIGVGTTIFLVNSVNFGGSSFTNDYSMQFDGVDEYLIKSTAFSELDGLANVSYSFWVKFNTLSNYDAPFGRFRSSDATSESMNVHANGTCDFVIANGGSSYGRASAGTFTTGVWYHIAICYNGGGATNADRLKVYKDGSALSLSFTGTIPTTLHTNATTGRFVVGGKTQTANLMNGNVDEFSVFTYTLTSGNVTSIYNSGTPTDLDNTSGVTAPVHWWRMGDGSDTITTINDVGTTGGIALAPTNMESGDIVTDTP